MTISTVYSVMALMDLPDTLRCVGVFSDYLDARNVANSYAYGKRSKMGWRLKWQYFDSNAEVSYTLQNEPIYIFKETVQWPTKTI